MKERVINCEYVTWPDGRRMASGVTSIAKLFGVSYPTASRYKNTFLEPAIIERGKKVFVDIDKAIELYSTKDNK